jgi:hypothetical protein
MDTVNIEDTPLHASSSNNIEDHISDKEIIKLLDENIPFQHREIYLKVKNGSKISKKDQRILYEIISSLLENKDE